MPATGPEPALNVELLCVHHRLDGFSCGLEVLDETIAGWVGQAAESYDPDECLTLVAVENGIIRGFMGLAELLIRVDDSSEDDERCLFLPYLAVDQRWQGADIALLLYRRARVLERMRARRGKAYAAVVGTTVFDESLAARFTRLRFKPVPGNSVLWYLRRRRS